MDLADHDTTREQIQAPPITIPTHGLTRYLRVRVSVIDHMGRTVRVFPLVVGVSLVVAPWFFLPWWGAALPAASGLWVILVALGPQLVVATRSGRQHHAAVCFGHQLDADLYMDVVRELASSNPET